MTNLLLFGSGREPLSFGLTESRGFVNDETGRQVLVNECELRESVDHEVF